MNDMEIIKDIQREYNMKSENKASEFLWKYRGFILAVALIIILAGIAYICYNIEFIQQNSVQYCKKVFIDYGCEYACINELVTENRGVLNEPRPNLEGIGE